MRIIIEKIIPSDLHDLKNYRIVDIRMTYHQRCKARQKIKLEGIEFLIALNTGERIKPNSYLYIDHDKKIAYRVVSEDENLIAVKFTDTTSAIIIAHTMGNMHIPIGLYKDKILTIYDETLEQKLKKLGLETECYFGPFVEISEVVHEH
ncbi:MAG: hypothetical protein N3D14_03530 [Aquificaceae bacterium]|nr:hypothetical protein [Aquificaceae bacterium]